MNMIERVAQAMDTVAEKRGTIDWRELARAAIEAMREPPHLEWEHGFRSYDDLWRATIDAALSETTKAKVVP